MKTKLSALLLFTCLLMSGQTKFKPGHYINLNNEKVIGFIKDYDWKNNPYEIEFKTTLDDNSHSIINKDNLKEFEIYENSKYINTEIQIDKSSNLNNQITSERELIYQKEKVLLKVLIEGEASLYQYQDEGVEKFFYSSNGVLFEQLVFKLFLASEKDVAELNLINTVSSNSLILKNEGYKKQLFQNVNCNFQREKIYNLIFAKSKLYKYFEEYNKCKKVSYKTYKKNFETQLKLKGVLNLNLNSLNLNYFNDEYRSKDFGNSTNFGFGLELELILPFNNNKWSVFTEPTYNTYENSAILKKTFSTITTTQKVNVKYDYIQLPVGVKHYFFLSDKINIDLNLAYNLKFTSKKSIIDYEDTSDFSVFPTLKNFAFGFDVNFQKATLGVKYFTKTQILNGAYEQKYADYKNLSLQLKYQIL